MINALTIDLEYWHNNTEFLGDYIPEEPEDQLIEATTPILELLEKYHTRATFFTLGNVAKKYPEIVERIYDDGHEIGSHTHTHKTLYTLKEEEFENEIKESVHALEKITGEKPIGFRAPYFSMNNSTRWALKILKKYKFKYDSSVFPIKVLFKAMPYGVPNAPTHPYRPSFDDLAVDDPNGSIIEFPMTVLKIWGNIPIAGGFYLRLFPFSFLKYAIKKVNKKYPAIIYVHPHETYPGTPRLPVPYFSRFIAYHGINSALKKFEALLKNFRFKPAREVLEL